MKASARRLQLAVSFSLIQLLVDRLSLTIDSPELQAQPARYGDHHVESALEYHQTPLRDW
jgi:hypothetical protein